MYPPNFLVLDEPTNHLDLVTKEMLIEALARVRGHDALRVARPGVPARRWATACSSSAARRGTDRTPHRVSRLLYRVRRAHGARGAGRALVGRTVDGGWCGLSMEVGGSEPSARPASSTGHRSRRQTALGEERSATGGALRLVVDGTIGRRLNLPEVRRRVTRRCVRQPLKPECAVGSLVGVVLENRGARHGARSPVQRLCELDGGETSGASRPERIRARDEHTQIDVRIRRGDTNTERRGLCRVRADAGDFSPGIGAAIGGRDRLHALRCDHTRAEAGDVRAPEPRRWRHSSALPQEWPCSRPLDKRGS